jgi:hypothetical protein
VYSLRCASCWQKAGSGKGVRLFPEVELPRGRTGAVLLPDEEGENGMSFCNEQEICHGNGRRRAGEEWKNTPLSGEKYVFPGEEERASCPRQDRRASGRRIFFT